MSACCAYKRWTIKLFNRNGHSLFQNKKIFYSMDPSLFLCVLQLAVFDPKITLLNHSFLLFDYSNNFLVKTASGYCDSNWQKFLYQCAWIFCLISPFFTYLRKVFSNFRFHWICLSMWSKLKKQQTFYQLVWPGFLLKIAKKFGDFYGDFKTYEVWPSKLFFGVGVLS